MDKKKTQKLIPPKASDFEGAQEFFNHISNARDYCNERGYHRVS